MEEHKFTASDKRNDRRYERVESRHDGTAAAVFGMIWKDYQSWFIRIRLAYEIAEIDYGWASHINIGYIFKPITDLPDTWIHAFEAFMDAWRASMLLTRREGTLQGLAENRQRLIELAATKNTPPSEAAA
jgi:hypothetical protein